MDSGEGESESGVLEEEQTSHIKARIQTLQRTISQMELETGQGAHLGVPSYFDGASVTLARARRAVEEDVPRLKTRLNELTRTKQLLQDVDADRESQLKELRDENEQLKRKAAEKQKEFNREKEEQKKRSTAKEQELERRNAKKLNEAEEARKQAVLSEQAVRDESKTLRDEFMEAKEMLQRDLEQASQERDHYRADRDRLKKDLEVAESHKLKASANAERARAELQATKEQHTSIRMSLEQELEKTKDDLLHLENQMKLDKQFTEEQVARFGRLFEEKVNLEVTSRVESKELEDLKGELREEKLLKQQLEMQLEVTKQELAVTSRKYEDSVREFGGATTEFKSVASAIPRVESRIGQLEKNSSSTASDVTKLRDELRGQDHKGQPKAYCRVPCIVC